MPLIERQWMDFSSVQGSLQRKYTRNLLKYAVEVLEYEILGYIRAEVLTDYKNGI
jgi:hypothetical protein